jgi:succinate-semialdehyde dehydrogenase/glutarate-semialdehyde dehydrogenase
MRITQEEIFGPVATIFRFESESQVIATANSCDVGLASYVFTLDLNRAARLSEQIESGMVAINCGSVSDAPVPYVLILPPFTFKTQFLNHAAGLGHEEPPYSC